MSAAPGDTAGGPRRGARAVDRDRRAPGREAGYRIFADGRYESLWDGRWKETQTLTAEQLAAVRHAIEAVPLGDLAGRYENPGDPQVLWMQVAQDGQIRTVSVAGNRRVPELERLTALLTDTFR